MKRQLAIVLCFVGAAACSTNRPADDPRAASDVTPPVSQTNDGTMRPASSDSLAPRPVDAAGPTTSTDAFHHDGPASVPSESSTSASASPPAASLDDKKSSAAAPDNTKVNQRDTKSSALTPMDQGESQSDLDITKKIRQALMADHTLSFTAKNVKVITRDGKVVLRGPVKSAGERAGIEAAAQKVAGASNVDSQLEVKQ